LALFASSASLCQAWAISRKGLLASVNRDARLFEAAGRKTLVIFPHDRVIPDEKMMLAGGGEIGVMPY
jgi:hypothetical protein